MSKTLSDLAIYDLLVTFARDLETREAETRYGRHCLQSAAFCLAKIAATIAFRDEREQIRADEQAMKRARREARERGLDRE
ncbi:hypothetical protein PMES_02595 [Profundibacterium mesophilum KAUST100406-0324]|uniref:Uncharacterized protein n=1 Tax=Profundibacterium mesophilum KAUST100406-0324 TaxID=1037889 RepID=A0A921TE58_9RHOB|nr:hypothetical protein PMES_02595 [Profundibacterium mesophilum KAUST100406-0324]